MKYTVCILLYCTLFLVNSVYSLLGGSPIPVGTHPSHALVLVNNQPRGGTVVHVNHVVTSCRNVLNPADNHLLAPTVFTVRVGSIAIGEGGFVTPVIAVFPHPEFNPWTFENDVAVLRTTNPIQFDPLPSPNIAPAVFNERVIADQTNCIVVGFNNPVAGVTPLQELLQPILNRDTGCNLETVHSGSVLESMFCAGTLAATSGICNTTIGGGIYCNGAFTGIATSGENCGSLNTPGIYTQVRHHIQWITQQYTRTQIPQAGTTPAPGVSAGILSTIGSSLLISLAFLLTKL
ncbi:trypsin-like [Bradysia coprophila]|uniref:trypsin-like n=1 Tax=Bradysia coprophila TaxID=38358 RepID=UPI00187D7407|nr:trypsin-like [Bradysia coprophila]